LPEKVMANRTLIYFLLINFVVIGSACQRAPNIILTNGKIFTSDTTALYVEALAITGNLITHTGRSEEIVKLAGNQTSIIDLEGRTVVPGFNDAHVHLGWNSPDGNTYTYSDYTLQGPDKKAIKDSIRLLVKRTNPGEWIYGTIGLSALQDSTGLRRNFLDSIAPVNPVVLQVWWGHGMIVNSAALRALNISATAADPLGGWYERLKDTRELSGAVHEYAQWPFWNAITESDTATFINDLKKADEDFVRYGVTSFQQMNILHNKLLSIDLFEKEQLKTRARLISMPGTTSEARIHGEKAEHKENAKIEVSGIKYLVDGTTLDRTALISSPYKDKINWHGRLNFPADTIRSILEEALNSREQLMLHIVGDSAMSIVLNLMKEMKQDELWQTKRVRIEHNATSKIRPAQMKHVKDLGLIMMHTPQYGHASKLASWVRMGVRIGISPDGATNSFVNLKTVISDQKRAEENLSIEQAVISYTHGNAFAEGKERLKGSITPGKLADLAVLSQDIFTIQVAQIPFTTSVLTIVDGKILLNELSQ
jgi:predicted amidohydrolase YtcJ